MFLRRIEECYVIESEYLNVFNFSNEVSLCAEIPGRMEQYRCLEVE